MKMFRSLTGTLALTMIALTGCSTQSPDFTPRLLSIAISPSPIGTVPLGDTVLLTATGTCTTPPGSASTTQACKVDKVTWSVDSAAIGTIVATGPDTATFTAAITGVGATGNVVATPEGAPVVKEPVTLGPAVLKGGSLVISPTTPPLLHVGDTQPFTVTGTNTDGQPATLDPTTLRWTTSLATVATLPATSATTKNTATAVAPGQTAITVCVLDAGAVCIPKYTSAAVNLNVSNAKLTSISTTLTPATAVAPVGAVRSYQVTGTYDDGTSSPLAAARFTWAVTPATVATQAANSTDNTKQDVTAAKIGLATVKATLIDTTTLTDATKNTSTGTLTVVDAACTTPLSNQQTPVATTAKSKTGALCLVCDVANQDNVIDADPLNAAALNATLGVGLPSNSVTLTVNSNAVTAFPGGANAGFHIADPTGALLSANVLNGQIQVATLLNGAIQQSSTPYVAGGLIPLPPLLDITLLGLGAGGGTYVTIPTTLPYDAIQVTFGTGLVSLLSTVNVDSACATVDLTKVTP